MVFAVVLLTCTVSLCMCLNFAEIFSTPQVQSDEKRWKEALTKTVVFLVLAPFDSEVGCLRCVLRPMLLTHHI